MTSGKSLLESRANLGGKVFSPATGAPGGPLEKESREPICASTPGSDSVGEMSLCLKVFVFIMFTQLGQALMSYDGGATQMSTKALLLSGWSSSELGLLGAMDKFGQVATAFLWSDLLMRYNNKFLLALGLAAKAGSCIGFGLLSHKHAMLGAKLSMGVSEALIGVWATVWVQANAPRDSQARWLGLASVSAGIGNGAGSAVAGLCSKNLGYAFAFVLQGSVLFGLWGVLVFTPAYCFEFKNVGAGRVAGESSRKKLIDNNSACAEEDSDDGSSVDPSSSKAGRPRLERTRSSDPEFMLREEIARSMNSELDDPDASKEDMPFFRSLWLVLSSRLWLWTASAISLSCFITSAVSFMWQNTTESVWGFSDKESTFSFLFTTGAGGLVGVAFGPKLFDGYLQGFSTPSGVKRCLKWCASLSIVAAVLGTVAAFLFLDTAWHVVQDENGEQARGWLLTSVLLCVFLVFALLNSMQGTLYGINTDSTTPETKASAAALTVSMQNIIGFALGPLLPSITAEMVGHSIVEVRPEEEVPVVRSAQFSAGIAVSLFALWPLVLSVHLAIRSAKVRELQSEITPQSLSRPVERQRWSDLAFDPL